MERGRTKIVGRNTLVKRSRWVIKENGYLNDVTVGLEKGHQRHSTPTKHRRPPCPRVSDERDSTRNTRQQKRDAFQVRKGSRTQRSERDPKF